MPTEFYLRQVHDLDQADPAAVLEFTREFGRLAPLHDLDSDLPRKVAGIWHRTFAEHAAVRFGRHHARVEDNPFRVHVDEITYRARVLRQLTAHAIAYTRGDYEREVWPECSSEGDAWSNFTSFTNAALRPFHVRVWADAGDPEWDVGVETPSAYEAAVLQLVNDISEQVEYRPCLHCGRTFARQVGRSEQRSRLRGVTYCTPECSRAAAVKAYRARRRAERKAEDGKRRKKA